MRSFIPSVLGVGVALLMVVNAARAENIRGEYLEARNADVWTGPCFANGEMGIVGNKAILAWKVTAGTHHSVALDGLSVVAVVLSNDTFGIGRETRTRTLLLVDERADSLQRKALVDLAKTLAGETIQTIVGVRPAAITMSTAYCEALGCAVLDAGDAKIKTRCLCDSDRICGHEVISYPILSKVEQPYAAYTLENSYKGKLLGETFRDSNARSAVLAKFSH